MVQMAQRTSAEVQAILADHGGTVEVAFVDCVRCTRRVKSLYGGTDAEVTAEFVEKGWEPRKGTGWLCPNDQEES